MTTNNKSGEQQAGAGAGRVERLGLVILKALAPSLQKRGVPSSSYVMVNILNHEFVTGKTRDETAKRFKLIHPDAEGWMQQLGDITGATDPQWENPTTAGARLRFGGLRDHRTHRPAASE